MNESFLLDNLKVLLNIFLKLVLWFLVGCCCSLISIGSCLTTQKYRNFNMFLLIICLPQGIVSGIICYNLSNEMTNLFRLIILLFTNFILSIFTYTLANIFIQNEHNNSELKSSFRHD